MNKKLYVGNLPYSATEQMLEDLFSQVGETAEVTIIKIVSLPFQGLRFRRDVDGRTGSGSHPSLQRLPPGNRPLTVNEARPREDRSSGGGGGYGGGRGDRDGGYGGGRGGRGPRDY